MLPDLEKFTWKELELAHPWLLLLAVPAILLVLWRHRLVLGFGGVRKGAPALIYPSVRGVKRLPKTLRQRLQILLPIFELLAVILLVGAAARPRTGDSTSIVKSEGIAIQMVLDISGSMEQEMTFEGRDRKRIDIVKEVFHDFVAGTRDDEEGLAGRRSDLVGLTTFARFTEENCPLVGDHEQLLSAVERLEAIPQYIDAEGRPIPNDALPRSNNRSEVDAFLRRYGQPQNHPMNATAIGDGLMRAVLSMVTAEEDLSRAEEEGGYKIKGKVIILLTDGENNAGDKTPVDAGKFAEENDIRVYYVVFREPFEMQRRLFGRAVKREIPIDRLLEEPRKVAGDSRRAFLASDGDALKNIYQEIDELERTEIGKIHYRSYNELFAALILPGLVLSMLSLLLGETVFRRTP